MDISKQTPKDFAATALVSEQAQRFAALEAEEEALMAPIRARISKIRSERTALRNHYAEAISEALKQFSFEDLVDPLRAVEFYQAAFNGGWGISDESKIYRAILGGVYIFDAESYRYGASNELIYLSPRVSIPAEKDEALLALTAERVEAVHRANMEILGADEEALISVFDDGLGAHDSYHITFDGQSSQWVLRNRWGSDLKRASELIDILRVTPTYS